MTCAVGGQERHRTCTQPQPLCGGRCHGEADQRQSCNTQQICPMAGSWGAWSPPTPCPVTCGVGRLERHRACDSPSPRHNGRPCPGSTHDHDFCNTGQPCPVDGVWSVWGAWSSCERKGFNIRCKFYRGMQERGRRCLGREHGGDICPHDWFNSRKCFDVSRCSFDAYVWTAWGEWGLCEPPCGPDSRRTRRRTCLPVYEDEIDESVTITGSPRLKCVELEGRRDVVTENRTCLNVPTCR